MTTLPMRIPADNRLLIDVAELSRLTSLSVRTLRRLDCCRDIPGRVVVRRRVLFQLAAIREWCAASCPDRETWERQAAARGRA